MTWLEVVDSAVKIGLGAAIAGCSTLLLSKSQHRRDLAKLKSDREFVLLREIAEQTERFTQATLRYWSLASDVHRIWAQGRSLTDKKAQNLQESNETLFDLFHELTSSEAKLLLLGKRDVQTELRTYGDMVTAFRRDAMNNSQHMSDSVIETWRGNILRARERFLDELHACYRQLGP